MGRQKIWAVAVVYMGESLRLGIYSIYKHIHLSPCSNITVLLVLLREALISMQIFTLTISTNDLTKPPDAVMGAHPQHFRGIRQNVPTLPIRSRFTKMFECQVR